MRRRNLTIEQQLFRYKRRFIIVLSLLVLITGISGFYIYLNYDYLLFKHLISQNYIYTNTLDEFYSKELGMDVKHKYYSYFDDLVIAMVTDQIRAANDDRYTYLYIPSQYQAYFQQEKAQAQKSEVKPLNADTIYLHFTNFSTYTQKFVIDHIAQLKKYSNIIIDLRDNPGGDIDVLNNLASLFLPKGSVISTDHLRLFSRTYRVKKEGPLSYKKIMILQNGNTASSSENFIAALRENLNNVTLIGTVTFGKGIGQLTLPLKGGFAVKATTLFWSTPKGNTIQGKGIKPDIPYVGEDILQFALQKISE